MLAGIGSIHVDHMLARVLLYDGKHQEGDCTDIKDIFKELVLLGMGK